VLAVLLLAASPAYAVCTSHYRYPGSAPSIGPRTHWHLASNGNFAGRTFVPGAVGFNLADVAGAGLLPHVPSGAQALVWVGLCGGADSGFVAKVTPYLHSAKVFGYYLVDEPDPTGKYKPTCPAANLKAESDWIHAHDPGKKTFIIVMSLTSSKAPTFAGAYTPANTDVDLFGLDPYPCRSVLNGCEFDMIGRYVSAAEAAGIPKATIVPVYQAFGGGEWRDDRGGSYLLPTPAQERTILARWAAVVPTPAFDYAYSWGSQRGDVSLSGSPELQAVFKEHNGRR
jgi:hypothetical protein